MAKYRITTDGGTYDVETEDGQPQEKGLVGKAWDALKVPAEKSAEGLSMLGDMAGKKLAAEPTGNLPMDIAKNTPGILADSLGQSLSKVAPSFIDRTALATAGASKAVQGVAKIPAVARGIDQGLGQIEEFTGIAKGGLKAAAQDDSLIRSQGTDKAGKAFDALQGPMGPQMAPEIKTKMDVVQKLLTKANAGDITAKEAHEGRKIAWALRKNPELDTNSLTNVYDTFDGIVKKALPSADAAFQRGVMADSIRNVLPRTTTGKVAQLRSMGMLFSPTAWAASPVLHGTIATVGGAAGRAIGTVPKALSVGASPELIGNAYDAVMNRKKKKKGG